MTETQTACPACGERVRCPECATPVELHLVDGVHIVGPCSCGWVDDKPDQRACRVAPPQRS
jgi:primosomal protein N'